MNITIRIPSRIRNRNDLAWFIPSWAQNTARVDANRAIGMCNATHHVYYIQGMSHWSFPELNIYAQQHTEKTGNFSKFGYFTIEPPLHDKSLYSAARQGIFSFDVTFMRRSDVWRPYSTHHSLWTAARHAARKRLQRNDQNIHDWTIGVYVSNCVRARVNIIKKLVKLQHSTNLTVQSFGKCETTPTLRNYTRMPKLMTCTSHTFVLAVENSLCEDYITEKLQNAVECGAIPIILSHKNIPAYNELFGDFPSVDMGMQSEAQLTTILRTLAQPMNYRIALQRWFVNKTQTIPSPPFHCAWFNVKPVQRVLQPPRCTT
jgi:hypothetical protein